MFKYSYMCKLRSYTKYNAIAFHLHTMYDTNYPQFKWYTHVTCVGFLESTEMSSYNG